MKLYSIDTRYSPVFEKVELSVRTYSEEADNICEVRVFFTESELKEVVTQLSGFLPFPIEEGVEEGVEEIVTEQGYY